LKEGMSEKLNTIFHQLIHSKAKKMDVCEPMGLNVFNMGVYILAPNALKKAKGQWTTIGKHYMNLKFNICY
jgi:hypothetical protein